MKKLVAIILHLIDRGMQQMLAPQVLNSVLRQFEFKDVISKQRRYAPVVGYLMTPFALVGYVLAFWRLGADLNWLGEFFIAQGTVLPLAGVVGDRDRDTTRRRINSIALAQR